MKYLVLAVLLSIMQATPPVPRKAADNKAAQSGKQQNEADSQKNVPAPPVALTPPQRNGGPDPSSPSNKETVHVDPVRVITDGWYIAYVILTGCLVVIGIAGVYAAIRTLRTIERQALSMRRQTTHLRRSAIFARRSANAARKSADAIVNAERAWIMVDLEWEPSSAVRLTKINGGEGKKTGVAIRMICANEGRMPAWITYRAVHVEVANIPTGQTEFLPSESSENYIPIAAKGRNDSPWRSFGAGHPVVGKDVFIYGVVRYRDVFGPQRETWFGYLATDDGALVRIPQREYNRHT